VLFVKLKGIDFSGDDAMGRTQRGETDTGFRGFT
jgi:hypothetical protein